MNERIDAIILVYSGDSGLRAMLLDVIKKATGREDCSLCEITYGPLGKRSSWKECEARLGIEVHEMHRDTVPAQWRIDAELPCILARAGAARPVVLLRRDEIGACGGRVEMLETRIHEALARLRVRPVQELAS